MSYTKYISLTVLEDTCGVELPEGDAEFDDRQNLALACVESYGCQISKKFRMPGGKNRIHRCSLQWEIFIIHETSFLRSAALMLVKTVKWISILSRAVILSQRISKIEDMYANLSGRCSKCVVKPSA